jgi:hypothetical protein
MQRGKASGVTRRRVGGGSAAPSAARVARGRSEDGVSDAQARGAAAAAAHQRSRHVRREVRVADDAGQQMLARVVRRRAAAVAVKHLRAARPAAQAQRLARLRCRRNAEKNSAQGPAPQPAFVPPRTA